MSKKFGGLRKVSRSETKEGAKTDINGKIGSGTTLEPENIGSETGTGRVYGGSQLNGEVHVLSHQDYPTLETDMINDAEHYYHFHYKDGRILTTSEPINIFVRIGTQVDAREGVAPMIFDFESLAHKPMLEDTTPAE